MNGHADLLSRLLPPVSYDSREPRLTAELAAEGKALDRALGDAETVVNGITPFFAHQLLPDWERVCGITPPDEATLQQRVSTVVAKLNETGGMSIPYFTSLAAALGYRIEIIEPDPFRVDESSVGDALWIEDIIYEWGVVVHGAPSLEIYFRVDESAVGEPLLTFADPVLEAVFEDLKPADTFVYFIYLEE
ncbi:YmfQ family protein [Burkholderia mayonis]|uniref:Phage tail protein n=1 Tax=Burkholderia mayonis TaxID=1385591 RepID=A0A1B4G3W3_9BURK|nr:putative phage tail protein [Burkholderia mayonis]AOJ10609.1 phage tail protein [Burkholderia mayonis]KVE53200.1 phage tail protein [Burkholderia mayonis]